MGTGSLVRRVIDLDKVDGTFNKLGLNIDVYATVELSNGQYLVGGEFTTSANGFNPLRLVRLNADGSIDQTFDTSAAGLGLGPGLGGGFVNNIVELSIGSEEGKYMIGGDFIEAERNPDNKFIIRTGTEVFT